MNDHCRSGAGHQRIVCGGHHSGVTLAPLVQLAAQVTSGQASPELAEYRIERFGCWLRPEIKRSISRGCPHPASPGGRGNKPAGNALSRVREHCLGTLAAL